LGPILEEFKHLIPYLNGEGLRAKHSHPQLKITAE
jgi:hypothetical protein